MCYSADLSRNTTSEIGDQNVQEYYTLLFDLVEIQIWTILLTITQ